MKKIVVSWMLAALSWVALPLVAQEDLTGLAGYFPAEYLDLVPPEAVSVEVNLEGAMLQMIAAFAGKDEPEFAALVGALQAIRVRSGEFGPGAAAGIDRRLQEGQSWLAANGWLPMVRVKEDEEQIYVYSREHEGDIVGFTILAVEDGEATAVNLIGRIDPAQLVALIEGLDLGVLDDIELGNLGAER